MKLELTQIQHYPIGGENALVFIQKNVEPNNENLKYSFAVSAHPNTPDSVMLSSSKIAHSDYICKCYPLADIKPLLRPMSDLYKEIDGKIGIVELAKIVFPNEDWVFDNQKCTIEFGLFEYKDGAFKANDGWDTIHIPNQLALFEYLFSNHYDVFDLIGQNLAINKTV